MESQIQQLDSDRSAGLGHCELIIEIDNGTFSGMNTMFNAQRSIFHIQRRNFTITQFIYKKQKARCRNLLFARYCERSTSTYLTMDNPGRLPERLFLSLLSRMQKLHVSPISGISTLQQFRRSLLPAICQLYSSHFS